jgi:hypothetical protein
MLKAFIMEDAVAPLIKHFESAKNQALNHNSKMVGQFEEVEKEIREIQDALDRTRMLEDDLIESFGEIERHINNMLDDKDNNLGAELDAVLEKIRKTKDMVKRHEKLSNGSSISGASSITSCSSISTTSAMPGSRSQHKSKFEVGESSKPRGAEIINSRSGSIAMSMIKDMIDTLNVDLRNCLFCLSVFPENSIVKKRLLVYWWIGIGMVPSVGRGNYSGEEIGDMFFNDLVNKGFLVPEARKHNGVVDRCVVQPRIHKQLVSTARRNKFFLGNQVDSLQNCMTRKNSRKVQTLLNVDQKYLKSDVIRDHGTSSVAVMQIGQWQLQPHHIELDKTDFLKDFGSNLTYLSLRGISRISVLPASIGDLVNLIILDLRACHNLEKLPRKIRSLPKLTHLDVSFCYLLDHMPKWVGTLSNLEVLKGFVIASLGGTDQCQLGDLSNLRRLRKLSITVGRKSFIIQEHLSNVNLRNLSSLTITWGLSEERNEMVDTLNVPEVISLTENKFLLEKLEKLDLRCFPESEAPNWLSPGVLKNLKKLYIRGGKLNGMNTHNNPGGRVWKVEILRLRFLKYFKMSWSLMHVLFENLNSVEYVKCDNLTGFPGKNNGLWRSEDEI